MPDNPAPDLKVPDLQVPDAQTLLRQTARILKGTTYAEVWALLLEGLGFFGIKAVRYGLTRSRYGMSLGDLQDILFLSSLGEEDFATYIETGLYRRSPHYRWLAENVGAVSLGWFVAEARAGRLLPDELAVQNAMEQAGQPAGYLLSFPSDTSRLKGGLGMMGQRHWTQGQMDALWQDHGEAIEAMCLAAHLNIGRMPLPSRRNPLRPRQREMLEWIADGKTMQDVAVLTGLSVATVEKHLRGARDALDVDTTAQAIARAALMGHLFVVAADETA
jgi:LuxR family transcriptional regulator